MQQRAEAEEVMRDDGANSPMPRLRLLWLETPLEYRLLRFGGRELDRLNLDIRIGRWEVDSDNGRMALNREQLRDLCPFLSGWDRIRDRLTAFREGLQFAGLPCHLGIAARGTSENHREL